MSTDWESHYRSGEMPWDKGAPSPALLEALERVPVRGRVLVPGCGMGHDVRALAAQPNVTEVVGLDIAPSAVEAASAIPAIGRERYLLGDLFAPDSELVASFDWVWEHTCFCAIPPERRADYVASIAKLLAPGGQFFGVFYLDPGQDRPEEGPPFETRLSELDRLFSASFTLQQQWLPSRTYEGRAGREWVRWYTKKT